MNTADLTAIVDAMNQRWPGVQAAITGAPVITFRLPTQSAWFAAYVDSDEQWMVRLFNDSDEGCTTEVWCMPTEYTDEDYRDAGDDDITFLAKALLDLADYDGYECFSRDGNGVSRVVNDLQMALREG